MVMIEVNNRKMKEISEDIAKAFNYSKPDINALIICLEDRFEEI